MKKGSIFAPAFETVPLLKNEICLNGPFVYRLGRKIFILERGVRLPYGLLKKIIELTDQLQVMANHPSAEKRIRQSDSRRLKNRYVSRTTRNSVRSFRELTSKEEAQKQYPQVCSMLDKLAKKKVIHQKKADNLKSKLAAFMNKLD